MIQLDLFAAASAPSRAPGIRSFSHLRGLFSDLPDAGPMFPGSLGISVWFTACGRWCGAWKADA